MMMQKKGAKDVKMMIKEYLDEKTVLVNEAQTYDAYTTSFIASKLGLSRSMASTYLNELVDSGVVIKIKQHPIIFLATDVFAQNFFVPEFTMYNSLSDLWEEAVPIKDVFDKVVGHNGSLNEQIGQIKTAVKYPDGGLSLMLLGASGSGKTFLAEHVYQYSKQERIIDSEAPFISLNCAQYYNNPELLSSLLFGYKKGAFTGANEDTIGLLEQANQGILFLDEVHRLSEEGQEKLFTFMDTGTFSPIGDTSAVKKVSVRLIFATTQSIHSTFLPTFMRRIPVIVSVPSFSERPNHERLELIDLFFRNESKILKRKLKVSNKIIHYVMDYKNEGNIGKVQNIIKYSCAHSFSRNKKNEWINVTINDLPTDSKRELSTSSLVEHTKYVDRLYDYEISEDDNSINAQQQKIQEIYLSIYGEFNSLQANLYNKEQYIREATASTNLLMEDLIFNFEVNTTQSVFHLLSSSLEVIFHELENMIEDKVNGNIILSLAHLLFYKDEARFIVPDFLDKVSEESLHQFVKKELAEPYWIANQIASHLKETLEMTFYLEDVIFMTFYLNSMNIQSITNRPECLIVAHGYSTASSIANFTNRLLDKNIFKSIDMPFDASVNEVEIRIKKYMNQLNLVNGLILLVDMGSLINLKNNLISYINSPILLVDYISTPIALEIGNYVKSGYSLNDINEAFEPEKYRSSKNLVYPQENKQKALITCCYSGMGSAIQIQDILEKTLKNDVSSIKVIPYDYHKLLKNKHDELPLKLYDVIGIIGTANPKIDSIPYIGIENLITGEHIDILVNILHKYIEFDEDTFRSELVFNFSIKKVLENITILDAEKALSMIKKSLESIEKRMNIRVENNRRFIFYMHAASMIERVLRKEKVDEQKDIDEYKEREQKNLEIIAQAFTQIEQEYVINISDFELRLLNDILII